MVAIRRSIIPTSNVNYPNLYLNNGDLWITVHETGNTNAGANAKGEEGFMWSGGGPETVAYHFAVDQTEAVQLLPLNIVGWHAGDGCDSRVQDVGCFASIAIETCVGSNNAYKDATRKNLIELITAIISGDSRIDYRGTDYKRFSSTRIAPHKRWSSYSKDCPHFMLGDGYFYTIQGKVEAALGTTEPTTPTDYVAVNKIAEVQQYKTGDINKIPAVIDVTIQDKKYKAIFVGDTVECTKVTPRLQLPAKDSKSINKDIVVGESFKVDWLVITDDAYYISPWDTIIRVADTKRTFDGAAA